MKSLAVVEILIAVSVLIACTYLVATDFNCHKTSHDCPGIALYAIFFFVPSAMILAISAVWLLKDRSWWSQASLICIPIWAAMLVWLVESV